MGPTTLPTTPHSTAICDVCLFCGLEAQLLGAVGLVLRDCFLKGLELRQGFGDTADGGIRLEVHVKAEGGETRSVVVQRRGRAEHGGVGDRRSAADAPLGVEDLRHQTHVDHGHLGERKKWGLMRLWAGIYSCEIGADITHLVAVRILARCLGQLALQRLMRDGVVRGTRERPQKVQSVHDSAAARLPTVKAVRDGPLAPL